MSTVRKPGWLNPTTRPGDHGLWTFTSERSAVRFMGQIFAPHWCIARRRVLVRKFVVCDPRTAKRHGWRVVRKPTCSRTGSGR